MPHFRVRACRHSFINHIQALCRRQSNVGAQNHHCNTYESCLAFRRLHVLEGSTKKQQRVSWIHPLASMTCSKLAPSRLEPLKPPSMCTHHPPLRKTSLTPSQAPNKILPCRTARNPHCARLQMCSRTCLLNVQHPVYRVQNPSNALAITLSALTYSIPSICAAHAHAQVSKQGK
jgi:hypothetical protein